MSKYSAEYEPSWNIKLNYSPRRLFDNNVRPLFIIPVYKKEETSDQQYNADINANIINRYRWLSIAWLCFDITFTKCITRYQIL